MDGILMGGKKSRCPVIARPCAMRLARGGVPAASLMALARGRAFRPRWPMEDDAYRELKEGSWLEQQRWGGDVAAALGRRRFPCLAFKSAQVSGLQAGEQLASMAIG